MNAMYASVKLLSEQFDLSQVTIRRRIDEMKNQSSFYGRNAILDDGSIRVFLPAFLHFLENRRFFARKNLRKCVSEYDPQKIIRQLALDEWGATSVPTEPDREQIREVVIEILRGIT